MAKCKSCGSTDTEVEFYKRSPEGERRHGPYNLCKECMKRNNVAYMRTRPSRGMSVKKSREVMRLAAKSYRERYPQKARATAVLRYAVRSGKVKRLPCDVCGASESEGHHDDYNKPLDVRWLCRKHHMELHRTRTDVP